MKKILLWVLALVFVAIAIPFVSATACQAGCSSCSFPWNTLSCDGAICSRMDYIANWSINPCISQPLNFTTPVQVSISATSHYMSQSGLGLIYYYCQNVSLKAEFYYGQSFIQSSGWTAWDRTGVPKHFNFTANHTGSYSVKLYAKYDSNASWDTRLINFTVASNTSTDNSYYGDCITTSYEDIDSNEDNAFYISGDILPYWGRSAIWVFLTLLVVALTWYGMERVGGFQKIKFSMLGLIAFFMLVVGAIASMISWVYIGVIFVIISVYFGTKLAKIITGNTGR